MFRGKDLEEIVEFKRQGLSIRAINRVTGYDRKTIHGYLHAPTSHPVYGQRVEGRGKLEPFKPYIDERLRTGV